MGIVFDAIPTRQILSYRVRGPELETIFDLLSQEGPFLFEKLSQIFAGMEAPGQPRKTDLLLDALDFLRAVELIGRWRNEDGMVVYQVIGELDQSLPFRLLLLRQFHQMTDKRDAFRIAHKTLVAKDAFLTSKSELLKELEGMYPEDYAWNTEKLRSWEWLAEYLGLVRSLESHRSDLMVCPSSDLLTTALETAIRLQLLSNVSEGDGYAEVLIGEWLDHVNQDWFNCYTDRRQVHHGLASALLSMESANRLKLMMASDAPGASLLCERRVSHIRIPVNSTK